MRLAAKLILLYLFGLGLIVAVFTWLTIQNQRRTAAIAHGQEASHLVAAIRPLIDEALAAGNEERVREHLRIASRQLDTATLRFISPGREVMVRRTRTVLRPTDRGLHMVTAVPIWYGNRDAGTIEIDSVDPVAADNLRQSVMTAAMALISVTVLSSAVIFMGGLYLVGRPLRELIRRVDRIGEGDFESPSPAMCCRRLGGRDELGQLGRAIEAMRQRLDDNRQRIERETATRISAQQQLWHADRLGTVGRLAAGVAHEVGTPLAVVSGHAELIADGSLDHGNVRRSASIIKEQSDRIGGIIRQLLGFARAGQGSGRIATPVRELVDETVGLLETLFGKRRPEVHLDGDSALEVKVDRSQMQQVLTNLFSNAVDAGATRLNVSWKCDGDWTQILIEDNGAGMDDETAKHLFEPFFTTKDVGSGTGLGLSIVYGIIEEHQGKIRVESQLDRGSRFVIELPKDASDAESPVEHPSDRTALERKSASTSSLSTNAETSFDGNGDAAASPLSESVSS